MVIIPSSSIPDAHLKYAPFSAIILYNFRIMKVGRTVDYSHLNGKGMNSVNHDYFNSETMIIIID